MNLNVSSRVVIITGAASGLGWEITQQYFLRGDVVVLVDLQRDLLEQREHYLSERADSKNKVMARCLDITDRSNIENLLSDVQVEYGRLDVLVNNAGITHRSLVEQTNPDVFRKVIDVNLLAAIELAAAALPLLKVSRGSIVNVSSMAGWVPVMARAAYCASKGALHQFFEVLRSEQDEAELNILMVYPSFLDTPIETSALGGDGEKAKHKRSMVGGMKSAHWMAEQIVAAELIRKHRLFPDRFTWWASLLYKIAPSIFLSLMKRKFSSELDQVP